MGNHYVQPRDLEILRTLLRLRYLTGRELRLAFFPSHESGRQRIRALSRLDLIHPHAKGLQPGTPYRAWRLTTRGIDLVAREFPNEPIPDGLYERLVTGSLYNLHHREALASLYLELVRGGIDLQKVERSPEATRAFAATLRARASEIQWAPDGDVVLRYRLLEAEHQVVPDATIVSPGRRARVFLELDRSTKTLGRIRETLERYRNFVGAPYAKKYPDGFAPVVVFMVPSRGRLDGVARLAKSVLGSNGVQWAASTFDDAALLDGLLFEPRAPDSAEDRTAPGVAAEAAPVPRPAAAGGVGRAAAKGVYRSATEVMNKLVATGLADALNREHPELLPSLQKSLLALYDELHRKGSHA